MNKQLVFSFVPLIDKNGDAWKPFQFFYMAPTSARAFIKKGLGIEGDKASLLPMSTLGVEQKAVKAPANTDFSISYLGKFQS